MELRTRPLLCGGFKDFLFSSLLGEDSDFDYFSNGLKPPTSLENFFSTDFSEAAPTTKRSVK